MTIKEQKDACAYLRAARHRLCDYDHNPNTFEILTLITGIIERHGIEELEQNYFLAKVKE